MIQGIVRAGIFAAMRERSRRLPTLADNALSLLHMAQPENCTSGARGAGFRLVVVARKQKRASRLRDTLGNEVQLEAVWRKLVWARGLVCCMSPGLAECSEVHRYN